MEKDTSILVEIAVFTPNAAIVAQNAGAHRVELCSGYSEGGLSPSAGTIEFVRKSISIPIHVMVRPRIGDFCYNADEKRCILSDIDYCKSVGVNGIVFGALTPLGVVDMEFTKQVVEFAYPMSVTFHRAFDLTQNLYNTLDDLIACGVTRVLTSGGKPNTLEGINTIAALVKQAKGQIVVLPGGGITADNVQHLIKSTGVREVHFSGKQLVKSQIRKSTNLSLTSCGEVSDLEWYEACGNKIKSLLSNIG